MERLRAFISELKRRRVLRALVGWGIASFAALQVVEPLMHALDLPDWTLKAVVGVLALGFPVTSVLAWTYDLRTSGIQRTEPADPASGPERAPGEGRAGLVLLLVGLGLVVAAPGAIYLLLWRPAAQHKEPPAGERILVAVADFENDTGEPELDALSGLLITSLEQSRRLEVLTRSRMLDILREMGHASTPRIDESLGREVGRKAAIRALVLAAIHRFDTLYTIEMKALDPGTSAYLFTLKEDGKGKASVPGMIDRLSERTRELLRERPADVESSRLKVAEAITSSMEAYRHYFNGKAISYGRGDYAEAIRQFQRAVAIDPGFAMANYEIAYLGVWTDMPEAERRAALDAALRNVDRVPQKERDLMLAWKAHQDGRDEEADAIYARAVKAFPRDKDLQFYAGDLRFHAFLSPRGSARDLDDVLPFFEAGVALDPTDGATQWHHVACLLLLGRDADAVAAARAWLAAAPSARAHASLAAALGSAGRADEALQEYQRAAGLGVAFSQGYTGALGRLGRFVEARRVIAGASPSASTGPALIAARVELFLYEGRYREALEALESLPESGALETRVGLPERYRTAIYSAMGAGGRAWDAARPLVEAEGGVDYVPVYLALAGQVPHAAAAARLLVPGSRQLAFHEAVAAWRSSRVDEAAVRLETLSRSKYGPDRLYASALLGELEAGRGRDGPAIEALERHRAVGIPGSILGEEALRLPRTLLLLARSYERSGDRARARERLDQLLTLWARADPDLPLLREARELQARLQARPGRRGGTAR